MKKFILLYKGPATPMENMTPEAREKVGGAWKTWMEKLSSAMVDMGYPMANGQAVVDDGSSGQATKLNGYSIIQAEDMGSAMELVKDHPFLSDKTGNFTVEVHELLPQPKM